MCILSAGRRRLRELSEITLANITLYHNLARRFPDILGVADVTHSSSVSTAYPPSRFSVWPVVYDSMSSSMPHRFTSYADGQRRTRSAGRETRTWCLFSASFLVNVFPHPPLQKNGFSPVCVSRWRLRSCCRLNDSAHMSHANGRGGEAGYELTC